MIKIKGYYALFFALLFVIMVISPLPLLNSGQSGGQLGDNYDKVFLIKDAESGEIEAVEETDYVVGVLAGEMSPDSPAEALKAQAVASYTYALYKRNIRLGQGLEYDMQSSHKTDQEYINKTEQVALWQENYAANRKIFEDIASAVRGMAITFAGKPILAVYHSVSAGKTQGAADVWTGNYPYLQNVESAADMLAPDYQSEVVYSSLDFADRALELGITLVGEPNSWLSTPQKNSGGYVATYLLAGHETSGADMRKAFALASSCFELTYTNEKFVFTVKGKGHGVGMSQFGAKYMALQGDDFEKILGYYYPGTVIEKNYLDN